MHYIKILCLLPWWWSLATAQNIQLTAWENLTQSGKLPPECHIQKSNNNIDLVTYQNRYYLAFRTAPSHFASPKCILYLVSSTDLKTWTFEKAIQMNADLREPRWVVYQNRLSLYFFSAGKSMFSFSPEHLWKTDFQPETPSWSEPENIGLDGFVPWRFRQRNDTLYLSAYWGKNLYRKNHRSNLRLFWSTNGKNWNPLSEQPQIETPYAEEGEFIFDQNGDLYATIRLEGTGALIARAPRHNLSEWQTKRSRYKYDSALFFEHQNELYLISRKNNDGVFDKVKNRKDDLRGRVRNLVRYWFTTKTTALFKLNKETLELVWIKDLGGTGDNAFPALVQTGPNQYALMNYSSNIKKKNLFWLAGQLGRTDVYLTELSFD